MKKTDIKIGYAYVGKAWLGNPEFNRIILWIGETNSFKEYVMYQEGNYTGAYTSGCQLSSFAQWAHHEIGEAELTPALARTLCSQRAAAIFLDWKEKEKKGKGK